MSLRQQFRQAYVNQRGLKKHRSDPLWIRLVLAQGWTLAFGTGFLLLNASLSSRPLNAAWWGRMVPAHVLVSVCVMLSFFFLYRGFEKFAPQRWLDQISRWKDWRSGLFFSVYSTLCALLGVTLGMGLVDAIWYGNNLSRLLGSSVFWVQFGLVSTVISLVLGMSYRARWKREQMQARMTEAQLRLLQGQIEPHFLFNTLANVQSLIDFDPERAKLMLERFTDYLRASLGQLRGDSTTLAREFAMLEAYLGLMQLRMGERLRMRLTLPPELADYPLPPLLLQPLVENAIHHGLEPRIEGGEVAVSARVEGGRLCIEVADDGQGLDGPRRPGQRSNGVALANLRERLKARWGDQGMLELRPREGGGTLARLCLPLDFSNPTTS
ncbi:MAG: sensor histidine kinase [Roseateles sp.]|nr:MAG: sensor histidine kinase [Roseateles sp.]